MAHSNASTIVTTHSNTATRSVDPTVYGTLHMPAPSSRAAFQTSWLDELEDFSDRFHYEDIVLEAMLFGPNAV